jgi:UDP-N-acetylmuramyl pentapeptide phosphotransferase/UDP-N-acetylglucosamine-1-phosphate transferase
VTDRRLAAVVAAAAAAGVARAGWALRDRVPGGPRRWERVNHRGEPVTLLEGPAWAVGALTGLAAAPGLPARLRGGAALAVAGSAVLGAVDDLAGSSADKGLRGHLGALARGRLTTGGAKVLGIGATGVATAALLLGRRDGQGTAARAADVLVAGGVVAGAANLLNLLDLRPGRALKATLVPAALAVPAGPAAPLAAAAAGASAALLPEDLRERAMLGDSGANAAGALLGTALVAATAGRRGGAGVRAAALAGLVALTLASERVSFTRVIEGTPVLRGLDALGRRR